MSLLIILTLLLGYASNINAEEVKEGEIYTKLGSTDTRGRAIRIRRGDRERPLYPQRIPSNKIPSNKISPEKSKSNKIPSNRIPSNKISPEKTKSNRIPSNRVPSKKIPSKKTPENKIPRRSTRSTTS